LETVGGRTGWRRGGAVYSGSLRLRNHKPHGTDHDSKSLPPPPGIRLPTSPLRLRQEKHRSGRPVAGGLGGDLLGVPTAGTRLRSSSPSVASSSFLSGAFWFSCYTACGASSARIVAWSSRRFPGAMVSTS